MEGYIKLYRKLLENPILWKDHDYLALWLYLLLKATHREIQEIFKGEVITLKPGQLITGRQSICEKIKVSESKVQRMLKKFETEHQIEQHTCNQNRLITIVNWELYQIPEQLSEQPVNNECTTNEQPVNTNKNEKNEKNDKNDKKIVVQKSAEYPYKEIIDYLNSKAETAFKDSSKDSRKHIKDRCDEGYTVEDFKKVIDTKVEEWKKTDMSKYLRPATLFGTNFEGYLNQKATPRGKKKESRPENQFKQFPQRDTDLDALVMQEI